MAWLMLAFLRAIMYINHSDFKGETVGNLSVDNMYLFNVGVHTSNKIHRPFQVELQKLNITHNQGNCFALTCRMIV